ncbi:hypothetical protein L873DRAFT_1887947 [Choiromyces venosus 120613-1]|uniref:Uncharacterized protein n=1 Tax=Choiromyces venosus 120613-1 TaxID=1336337 RepID=A0A3N4JWC8_9PEZI|nr:hypothetical protein L873DRAFT_1887947 [Choiromyces venosus 120613-1]
MTWRCAWLAIEMEVFQVFIAKREDGRFVRRGWFRCTATMLFKKYYSSMDTHLFVFSAG